MENISKAIDIAAGTLLFVIAATVSVILYSQMMDFSKHSFLVSDLNSRTEFMINDDIVIDQTNTVAEMIMTLVNINTLGIDEIKVKTSEGINYSFKPKRSGSTSGRDSDIFIVSGVEKEISKYNFKAIEPLRTVKYSSSFNNNVLTFNAVN